MGAGVYWYKHQSVLTFCHWPLFRAGDGSNARARMVQPGERTTSLTSPAYLPSLGKDAFSSGVQVPQVSFLIVGCCRINRKEPLA